MAAEGAVGHRGDQHAVGAADIALDHLHGILRACVDGQLGTQTLGQLQLGVIHIHRHHVQPHRLGVLHRDMTEAADAGDHHPLAGACTGDLEALVDSDTGAENRRDLVELDVLRQDANVVRVGQHVFGVAAIDRVAGVLLAFAEGFPASQAVLAAAAGGVQPGHADAIALLHPGHAGTHRRDVANAFMAGNERQGRFHRPVALGSVQVGVADAGGGDLHQDLTGAGHRHLDSSRRSGSPKA